MTKKPSTAYPWWVAIISTITSLTVFSTMTSYSMTAQQLAAALGSTADAVMIGETVRMVFWVIGLIVGGMVIGVVLGTAGHWHVGWWTCAISSALGLIASLMLATRGKLDIAQPM